MKWNNVYILICDNNEPVFFEMEKYHRESCWLPDYRCLRITGNRIVDSIGRHASLCQLDLSSKLIVLAHGPSGSINLNGVPSPANVFFNLLSGSGLRSVGLISFKACSLGGEAFLDEFMRSVNATPGTQVGWVKGYIDGVGFQRPGPEMSDAIRKDFRTGYRVGNAEIKACYESNGSANKRSDFARIRIVKGNVDVYPLLPSSRYFL